MICFMVYRSVLLSPTLCDFHFSVFRSDRVRLGAGGLSGLAPQRASFASTSSLLRPHRRRLCSITFARLA
jgi:hypothetical protein